jgi:hypothetical protein
MKHSLKLSALALALAGLVGSVQATPLPPGVGATPFDSPGSFVPAGSVVASNTQAVNALTFAGILRTAVVDGPEAGVNLDFYYQFTRTGAGTIGNQEVGKLTASDFGNFTTNVFQTASSFGIFLAGNQQATAAEHGTDGVIGFLFQSGGNGKIGGNETSWTQVVRTNATSYQAGLVGVINGSTATLVGYQPVPEPETYAMVLAGLGLIGAIARRRRQSKDAA